MSQLEKELPHFRGVRLSAAHKKHPATLHERSVIGFSLSIRQIIHVPQFCAERSSDFPFGFQLKKKTTRTLRSLASFTGFLLEKKPRSCDNRLSLRIPTEKKPSLTIRPSDYSFTPAPNKKRTRSAFACDNGIPLGPQSKKTSLTARTCDHRLPPNIPPDKNLFTFTPCGHCLPSQATH